MPRQAKRRRTTKSKKKSSRDVARKKRVYRKTNYKNWPRAPKVVPFNKIWRTPSSWRNQTIQKICETNTAYQVNVVPTAAKIGNVTNLFPSDGNGLQFINLQQCFEANTAAGGTANYITEYVNLATVFRYVRFKWIKVTLTPLRWEGAQPSVGEAEHPIIHYINDDGSAAQGLGPSQSYAISIVETLPAHQYGQRYFVDPLEFHISPITKNPPDKESPNYSSYGTWSEAAVSQGTTYVPNDNFYYGFSNVINGFRYSVKVSACVECKDLLLS
jgi:hypothetical protein